MWFSQNHTHYHDHMCLIALARVLGEHMPHFGPFGQSVSLRCLDTHTYEHKYTLKCVRRSNPFVPNVIQKKKIFYTFCFTYQWERCSQEGSLPYHSQSQVVYAYHVLNLSLQGCVWSKYHFWTLFLAWHENRNGCGHIMCLKHSPEYIDFKYIWVHGSISLGSSVFTEIQFLAFLALHRKRRGVARWNPAHVTSELSCVYTYQVLDL